MRKYLIGRIFLVAVMSLLIVFLGFWYFQIFLEAQGKQEIKQATEHSEPEDLVEFRKNVGGKVTPVVVLLKEDPVALRQFRESIKDGTNAFQKLANYAIQLVNSQDEFIESLADKGIRAKMRVNYVPQIDGSIRRVEYRFTYLMNGFVAYVADEDLKLLKEQPEVSAVYKIEPVRFLLDQAVDYSLGTHPSVNDRRLAVFGPTQELTPDSIPGHPENPRNLAIDGYEGQGINIAIIDSGVDWRHPMFGGTGLMTPLPRVSGNPARSGDNRKVIYYYALSSPGQPTDDFGHGTLVAACAAGFKVDGNTPPNPGYGLGRDGNGVGPTVSGTEYIGLAPQARIMSYKVCGPAPNCLGDIELAIEDAASPYTLVASGDTGPVPVPKPVADVINLSLGDTAGSATGATSVAANNAALNGTIVVASAGNSGPGLGTVGAPAAATMAIAVAASLDPGSTSGSDVLQTGQITGEPCDGAGSRPATCNLGTQGAGPTPEYGPASNANSAHTPIGIKLFPVAGGGDILQGSVSAHYVYVDLVNNPVPPLSVQNRIALVRFTGTFAAAANTVSTQNPAAILLISNVQSATAVQVVGGIPTYTISTNDADTLIDMLLDGEDNSPAPAPNPPSGAVSFRPIRVADSISLPAFTSQMASFSSRGPNDHPTANYRQIKPDVTAPGVGIAGAAVPDGLPDAVLGLGNPRGYTKANGTSFSGPITAGAMVLIRQRVRNQLGLDTVNLNDPNYRNKRFEAVTVARALLQNSATNLRTGLGVPESDPASTSVNDLGAGHINVAGALSLRAIMVSPTLLLRDADPNTAGDQREFNMPLRNPPALDPNGNLEVLLPTASFGNQPVAGVVNPVIRTRKVIIRDLGGGGGVYNLTVANNRNLGPNFSVTFTSDEAGNNSITSVRVPSRGQAVFYVRTQANGAGIAPNTEFQWYIYATHASTGQTLRMPFYYRAVAASTGGFNAPFQTNPGAVPGNTDLNGCNVDLDGNYTINWNAPSGTPPIGYRIQEATQLNEIYFDNADTPLVNGANARWSGSLQWISSLNPNSGSLAYFIPNLVQQNESLTMNAPGVALPVGQGAILSYLTNQSTEQDFDFINVELSSDGGPFITLGTFSGVFVGTREFDITPYAGTTVRVRFRMTSDLLVTDVGTYIEDIRIVTNNFTTIADVGSTPLSFNVTGRTSGTRYYRIAGIFSTPGGNVVGPFSNVRCVSRP